MKHLLTIITICLLATCLNTNIAYGSSSEADIVVALDGSGDFSSIQEAISAAPSNSDRQTIIYIKRGLYNTEKLIIPGDKINITLIGESRQETILSYHIYDCQTGKCPAEDAALWSGDNILTSATLTILGDGFRAENMTIQNTAGPVGQAQAITVRSDKCIFINIDFYGYQDTMYFWSNANRSYFEGCLVVGRTDYIYGSGTVFFESCEIRSWGGGWITAPSTGQTQAYGFVFNNCDLTYALNSPRGGDDGEYIRFGRPWHNYPKVAWLNCEMTEKINPQGWGDIWDMEYAATSDELHLYEYNNTGPGADMTGRANWVGIKELSAAEALNYTVQKVMAGSDNWDPTEEEQLVQTYDWTGSGTGDSWLEANNWDPASLPQTGEQATVDGEFQVDADGTAFAADLSLKNKATLNITANSAATYISVANASFNNSGEFSLGGKIGTKDSIFFTVDGILSLNAELSGVHALSKKGLGVLVLNAENKSYSGDINIHEGKLSAALANSMGKSDVWVYNGGTLSVGNNNAIYAKTKLNTEAGAKLELDADVTISEFYIDETLQDIGEYTAASNPDLILGSGKIIIGRPDTFIFHNGANGNWDVPENFTPALLPLTGETVICEEEMETTSTVFTADILIQNGGILRLRGDDSKNHTCTGTIFMKEGTSFKYNTSGSGMYILAPINIDGHVFMSMESSNTDGSTMTLAGPLSGTGTVSSLNNGKGVVNSGNLLLKEDNSGFSGTWDLTQYSTKYPTTSGYISTIEGKSENAFGNGNIIAGNENRVIFSHEKAAGNSLNLYLNDQSKAILNVSLQVEDCMLNGTSLSDGDYSASTHPEYFEGTGKITVGEGGSAGPVDKLAAFPGAEGYGMYATGGRGGEVYYVTTLQDNSDPGSLRYAINQSGPRIILFKVSGTIKLKSSLKINNDNITIAGQTAPGDGITLRDYPVSVDANNVIIRFLRFRMGDVAEQEGDALGGRYHNNIIVDHCSMSWSTDECVSFYHNEEFTLQWSYITESLRNSVHDKGSHGYGGIWGGKHATFHHNLLAHHDSRNPRLGETKGEAFALTDLVDLRNNVIYNWQGNSCYGAEGMNANIVNCYYKPGPATTKKERIISIDKLLDEGYAITNIWGKFYIAGNVLTGSTRATDDNWTYGVYNQFNSKYSISTAEMEAMRVSVPHEPGVVTTHTPEKAYERIMQFGGASLFRDAVDLRIIEDVTTGTATYMTGGNGSINGIVDTQDAVGGWPILQSSTAPDDTDEDGMPDDWENANGLAAYDGSDAHLIEVDTLYPNLDYYLHTLVEEIVSNQNLEFIDTTSIDIPQLKKENISLYFNHLSGEIIAAHSARINRASIYSLSGKLISQASFNSEEINWQTDLIQQGIYIVRLEDEYKRVFSKKIPVY